MITSHENRERLLYLTNKEASTVLCSAVKDAVAESVEHKQSVGETRDVVPSSCVFYHFLHVSALHQSRAQARHLSFLSITIEIIK